MIPLCCLVNPTHWCVACGKGYCDHHINLLADMHMAQYPYPSYTVCKYCHHVYTWTSDSNSEGYKQDAKRMYKNKDHRKVACPNKEWCKDVDMNWYNIIL